MVCSSATWYLYQMVTQKKRCARKEQTLLFDLYKSFDQFESGTNRVFLPKRPIFHHACAAFNELPSNISTMVIHHLRNGQTMSDHRPSNLFDKSKNCNFDLGKARGDDNDGGIITNTSMYQKNSKKYCSLFTLPRARI